jgi:catechol-2,3-dioxygenase
MPTQPTAGPRIGHMVLNVRDIEASHRFYTDALGFEQCGEMVVGSRIGRMRFYRGDPNYHHHLALVQTKEVVDEARQWHILNTHVGINHIALAYADRDEFLARVKFLQDSGVEFLQRGNHGMTHSVYIQDPDGNGIEVIYDLPAEVWEGDVNAALNYFEHMPLVGDEALVDNDDYKVFSAPAN